MAKLSKFAIDLESAKNGVTVDLGDGLSVTVAQAGAGNPRYQKVLRQLLKPYERQLKANTLDDDVFEDQVTKAYVEAVLLGWKGLEDDEGNEITYSKDKAYEILSNKENFAFKQQIIDLANEQAVFAKELKDDTKSNA